MSRFYRLVVMEWLMWCQRILTPLLDTFPVWVHTHSCCVDADSPTDNAESFLPSTLSSSPFDSRKTRCCRRRQRASYSRVRYRFFSLKRGIFTVNNRYSHWFARQLHTKYRQKESWREGHYELLPMATSIALYNYTERHYFDVCMHDVCVWQHEKWSIKYCKRLLCCVVQKHGRGTE